VTLHEAVRYYLKHVIAYRNSPPTSQIVERMLIESERNDRRDRTVQDLKCRFNVFSEHFSGRRLSDLTVEEIEGWIYEDDEWPGRSRINYLTKVSQILNYAIQHGWVESNLSERIGCPSVEDSDPEIFNLDRNGGLTSEWLHLISPLLPGFHLALTPTTGGCSSLRSVRKSLPSAHGRHSIGQTICATGN
jgi:hypothetical protein